MSGGQKLYGESESESITKLNENIEWSKGYEKIKLYAHSSRDFSNAFCIECGSAVPFINKPKTSLIIPAGSLPEKVKLEPQANIFTSEQACWLETGAKKINEN